jgi:predicted Na+-dependent transporter
MSGLSLSFDQLVKHTRNVRLHLIVQVMSFLVTSSVSSASPALLVQTSISTSPRSSA